MTFTYEKFTTRNLGFITQSEQDILKNATVFVCGTGGMGGSAILALVRAGIGNLILADIDTFEISNLNRQVFCFLTTVGKPKQEATLEYCKLINPECNITVMGAEWTEQAEATIKQADVVINATDDLGASLLLYRLARTAGKPVVDSYASPLPSVFTTKPQDPMPEERLNYPTASTAWNALTPLQRSESFSCEMEYVMIHSSSHKWIDLTLAGEMVAGKRSRMSFAPMVITAGMLMAYETFGLLLNKPTKTTYKGWFFIPYTAKVEHPKNPIIAAFLKPIVRRFLKKLTQ